MNMTGGFKQNVFSFFIASKSIYFIFATSTQSTASVEDATHAMDDVMMSNDERNFSFDSEETEVGERKRESFISIMCAVLAVLHLLKNHNFRTNKFIEIHQIKHIDSIVNEELSISLAFNEKKYVRRKYNNFM